MLFYKSLNNPPQQTTLEPLKFQRPMYRQPLRQPLPGICMNQVRDNFSMVWVALRLPASNYSGTVLNWNPNFAWPEDEQQKLKQ